MVRAEHRRPLSPLQQLQLEKKKTPAEEKGGDEGSDVPAKPAEAGGGEASKPLEDPFNPKVVDGALQLEKVSGGLVLI